MRGFVMSEMASEVVPEQRSSDDGGKVIPFELPCAGCGYDLQQQPVKGRCPECGRPVREALAQDRLIFAPRSWWRKMRTGLWIVIILPVWMVGGGFLGAILLRAVAGWAMAGPGAPVDRYLMHWIQAGMSTLLVAVPTLATLLAMIFLTAPRRGPRWGPWLDPVALLGRLGGLTLVVLMALVFAGQVLHFRFAWLNGEVPAFLSLAAPVALIVAYVCIQRRLALLLGRPGLAQWAAVNIAAVVGLVGLLMLESREIYAVSPSGQRAAALGVAVGLTALFLAASTFVLSILCLIHIRSSYRAARTMMNHTQTLAVLRAAAASSI